MSWMSGRDFSAWIISSFERRWQYTALVSGLFLAVDGRAARNNCRSRHIAIHKNRMTSASAASGAARAGSETSVCVVDGRGKIVKEAKVASEPEALVCFFKKLGVPVNRIGLEAGPLSQWLHAGLTQAGFQTVLLETRHVKAALSAMTVKT